jgi:hypothetical protein
MGAPLRGQKLIYMGQICRLFAAQIKRGGS